MLSATPIATAPAVSNDPRLLTSDPFSPTPYPIPTPTGSGILEPKDEITVIDANVLIPTTVVKPTLPTGPTVPTGPATGGGSSSGFPDLPIYTPPPKETEAVTEEKKPMETWKKVAIGTGIAGVVGVLAYLVATKKRKR